MRIPRYLFLLFCLSPTLAAQTPMYVPPRTEFGQPDFQGNWSNRTQTPISRPRDLGNQASYTEQEALAMEAAARDDSRTKSKALQPDREAPTAGESIRQQADQNFTDIRIDVLKVNGEYRTSMIVDPADGQFPFLQGGRQKDIFAQWRAAGHGAMDGPEIRSAGERCLSRGVPPIVVPPYNANYQIVQTRDYVMLLGEMVHDARIIRLHSTHPETGSKTWLGDSIGYWEGDTLVVHSINFRPEISHFRLTSSDQMELTERFTMINEQEIFYTFTVTDPQIYSQPFTEELTLHRRGPGEYLYEYACHEGNYSFSGILAGARRLEADARKLPLDYPEN